MLTLLPTAALAGESDFEPRLSAPSSGNSYYNRNLNIYSKQGYGMPNCTAYAYGRIYEITGEAPLIKSGNAGNWWFTNKRNDYYEYGSEPKLGAIACWSRHVAVVEAIDEDIVTISESHWRGKYFNTKTNIFRLSHSTYSLCDIIKSCGRLHKRLLLFQNIFFILINLLIIYKNIFHIIF